MNQAFDKEADKLTYEGLLRQLTDLVADLRVAKGEDRNERARRYAIVSTDLEKVQAYMETYVKDA